MFRGLITKLFGKSLDWGEILKRNPQFIDVRTPQEYKSGHIKGAKNIPLNNIKAELSKIQKNKPVIVYCKSGGRSAMAKGILKQQGFDVYNGGGFDSLQRRLNTK